jgi:hypothetical protein
MTMEWILAFTVFASTLVYGIAVAIVYGGND